MWKLPAEMNLLRPTMTSHCSNKRTYSQTPAGVLDFNQTVALQDKKPIMHASYTLKKHSPFATLQGKINGYHIALISVDV